MVGLVSFVGTHVNYSRVSLARNPWRVLKDARRAYRLGHLRSLTVDDMPDLKTYSASNLILAYLLFATVDFCIRNICFDEPEPLLMERNVAHALDCFTLAVFAAQRLPVVFRTQLIDKMLVVQLRNDSSNAITLPSFMTTLIPNFKLCIFITTSTT
jgi:hypothetical protein